MSDNLSRRDWLITMGLATALPLARNIALSDEDDDFVVTCPQDGKELYTAEDVVYTFGKAPQRSLIITAHAAIKQWK